MYYWQLEHKFSTCMMVLRAVRDVRNNSCHDRWIGRGGPTPWPPRSPDLNPWDMYLWGHIKSLVYAAPVSNEWTLDYRIVDACRQMPWHL
jgi:hypothetical protein